MRTSSKLSWKGSKMATQGRQPLRCTHLMKLTDSQHLPLNMGSSGTVNSRSGQYSKLIAERNSDKYEIKTTYELLDKGELITLTTPFTGFERLSLERQVSIKASEMTSSSHPYS